MVNQTATEDRTVNKKRSRIKSVLTGLIVLTAAFSTFALLRGVFTGFQWVLYFDKSYKGRVVEMKTKKPIEDAIVVALWPLDLMPSQGYVGYAKIIVETTDEA